MVWGKAEERIGKKSDITGTNKSSFLNPYFISVQVQTQAKALGVSVSYLFNVIPFKLPG